MNEPATTASNDRSYRALVRFLLLLGAIAALWLVAPAAAGASEGSSVLGGANDTVSDTTEAANDTVSDTTEAANDTVSDTTDAPSDTVSDTTEAANGPARTVENAVDKTAGSIGGTTGLTDTAEAAVGSVVDATAATIDTTLAEADRASKAATASIEPVVRTVQSPTDRVGDSLSTTAADAFRAPADGASMPGAGGSTYPRRFYEWEPVAADDARPDAAPIGVRDAWSPVGVGSLLTTTPDVDPSRHGVPILPAQPNDEPMAGSGSSLRDSLRGGSSTQDFAAILAAIAIALALVRWSRRESERSYIPVFLSRAERPG